MKSDIRLYTSLIIRKDSKYLICVSPVSGLPEWRSSPWDAWRTRIRANARSVADKTGGQIYLFNPVVGTLRKYVG